MCWWKHEGHVLHIWVVHFRTNGLDLFIFFKKSHKVFFFLFFRQSRWKTWPLRSCQNMRISKIESNLENQMGMQELKRVNLGLGKHRSTNFKMIFGEIWERKNVLKLEIFNKLKHIVILCYWNNSQDNRMSDFSSGDLFLKKNGVR